LKETKKARARTRRSLSRRPSDREQPYVTRTKGASRTGRGKPPYLGQVANVIKNAQSGGGSQKVMILSKKSR